MKSELLTSTNDRLAKLKDKYLTVVAPGEPIFQFAAYDFQLDYAEHLI